MNRMKIYDVPHKGLRNALSQFSLLAGKTDYSNKMEIEKLKEFGNDVFELLTLHAIDENEVSLAELEQRFPGSTKHDIKDHERLHQLQHSLEEKLSTLFSDSQKGKSVVEAGSEFYFLLNEFLGTYLLHIAEEESVTQPLFWKYFTDEELAAHRGKIMSKHPPETLFLWFRFVIPAQNHQERIGLLGGFKKMAPAAFFNQGMEVIREVLAEKEFENLQSAIS